MRVKTQLKKIASYSKGTQINGDELVEDGAYDYLNGGIAPSGKWNKFNIAGGTVTISEGGNSCGYVNYMKEPFWCGAHCYYLFDTIKNTEYLYYVLKSQQERLMSIRTGACMPNIKKADLGNFEIEYDTDEMQQEYIVSVLKKVEAIIDIRRRELHKLDELIKARFVEMFGDDRKFLGRAKHKVSDVCTSRVGIVIQPTQYYVEDNENSVKAFRSLNVKPFRVNDTDWVYFSKEDNEQLFRTQVHANDVAVVRSGANLGDSCLIPSEYDGCNAIDILLLTCTKDVLPIYLSTFINYPVGKHQLLNMQRGGAIKHLNLKQLENSKIYIPALELQQEFADFVNQVDKSKVVVQQMLNEAQTLFDSLMHEYFG